jgi:hypothetical protein
MELILWFCLGILFTLSVQALAYVSTRVQLPWYAWAMKITGVVAILFGIAWSGASFFEGIPQSGSMGLIFFSLPGLLMIVLAWRFFAPKGAQL